MRSVRGCTILFRVAFLCFLGMPLMAAEMKVWVVGDSLRIDPVSNRAYEANQLIFPDALSGDYKASNLVWDGSRRRISLKAARNEVVAFQIIVERVGESSLRDVNVLLGDMIGPDGKIIPKGQIDLYKEWYVHVRTRSAQDYSLGRGWYPDALLPCNRWSGNLYPRDYVLPFDVPDELNNIGSRQRNQAVWVDIYVPRGRNAVPAGIYKSTMTVTSSAGTAELSLELEIWDFALPDETHIMGNIHTDTEINTFSDDLELKYYQMMRRHRLVMGVLGYAPKLTVSGEDIEIDWSEYDARLGKYLDGRAFTAEYGYDGPGKGRPIELLVLPFDAHPMNLYKTERQIQRAGKEFKFYRSWPLRVPKEGPTAEYEAVFKKTFLAFQEHFNQHPGWDRTRLIVFFLSLDEAYSKEFYDQMIFYGKLLDESGADRLEFRIDGWYPMDVMERLSKYVDIVILGAGGFDPARVGGLRSRGIEDWIYTSAVNLDGDPLGQRALSWVCWKYGISSWTLWELDFNSLRAWLFPETYVTRDGRVFNGHGMLIYRGETMGLDGPVASIRLKLLRRGAQDYEYFWLLSRREGGETEARRVVDSIIREPLGRDGSWGAAGMWEHNSEDWERARLAMGALIGGR